MDNCTHSGRDVQRDSAQAQVRRRVRPANLHEALFDDPELFLGHSSAEAATHRDVDVVTDGEAGLLPRAWEQGSDGWKSRKKPRKKRRTKTADKRKTNRPTKPEVERPVVAPSLSSFAGGSLFGPGWLPPPPLYDANEVRRALRLLLPAGQVTELRALDASFVGERFKTTLTGYFDNPEALILSLSTIGEAKGIYIIPNPVEPVLLARAVNRVKRAVRGESTSDNNIIARRWLLVDFDPVRLPGMSSNDAEHVAALNRAQEVDRYLRGQGWPEPIVADSGNGGHLLYPIDLPVDDGGIVEKCLKVLGQRFTDNFVKVDPSVFNPARIWKLYGTAACKGDHVQDRPHRMSRILSAPD